MEKFIFWAGVLQVTIFIISFLVPLVLAYTNALTSLKPIVQKLMWANGIYTAGTILFLGLLSVLYPKELLQGEIMSFILLFYLIFWGARLVFQMFIYDLEAYLKEWWMKLANRLLTLVFIFLSVIYAVALFST